MKQEEVRNQTNHVRPVQIVVFRLGDEEYGLNIDQIKEVVITPSITRVPQKPSFIKGVSNIRGNIIAMLDLEEKFGLRKTIEEHAGSNFTLVIDSAEYKMGVLVKEVPNTLSIAESAIEEFALAGESSNPEQSYIKGIVKLDKRLIIMIDIFKVLSQYEEQHVFKKQTALV